MYLYFDEQMGLDSALDTLEHTAAFCTEAKIALQNAMATGMDEMEHAEFLDRLTIGYTFCSEVLAHCATVPSSVADTDHGELVLEIFEDARQGFAEAIQNLAQIQ